MTNMDEYKQKKIEEAFQDEDRVYDEFDVKIKRMEIKEKNGGKPPSNMELLEMLREIGPAREKTKKTIEKYGSQ